MLNRDTVAKTYKVCKPLVFRGISYAPGDVFDPVKAQCVPSKLSAFIRQRILGDVGPDLAEALREAQTEAAAVETTSEATSEASSDAAAAAEGEAGTQQPEAEQGEAEQGEAQQPEAEASQPTEQPVQQSQPSIRRQSGRRKS